MSPEKTRAVLRVFTLAAPAAYRAIRVARAKHGPLAALRTKDVARMEFLDCALMEMRRYLLNPPEQPKSARDARRHARLFAPGEFDLWRWLYTQAFAFIPRLEAQERGEPPEPRVVLRLPAARPGDRHRRPEALKPRGAAPQTSHTKGGRTEGTIRRSER